MKTDNIASIEGDGIGKEVVPEAHKVLKKIKNFIKIWLFMVQD